VLPLAFLGSVFHAILHGLQTMATYVAIGLVNVVNLVIAGVGAVIGTFINLLPAMPSTPAAPSGSWTGWLAWVVPVGPLLGGLTVFVGLWLVYLLARIPLRWVKAL